ncbi:MAG: rhodanese-like domain-containing protein [Paenibacillaceae bacterium]
MNTISPQEMKKRLSQGEALYMIDVREDEEVAAGMIPTAIHIPLGQLPERHEEIQRLDEIILVCRSGNRSGKAYEYLQMLGFTGLKNMTGGMLVWEKLD